MSGERAKYDHDELIEQITNDGALVFSHEWISDGPGAGASWAGIYLWKGRFHSLSSDFGYAGPFSSFDEALHQHSMSVVTSASTSIGCSLLDAEEVARRLCWCEGADMVEINGESWVYSEEEGKLIRKR